jgi:hypothetical protein
MEKSLWVSTVLHVAAEKILCTSTLLHVSTKKTEAGDLLAGSSR